MVRVSWMLFGLILAIVVGAAMMGAAVAGKEERVVAVGGDGGEYHGAHGAENGDTTAVTGGDGDGGADRGPHLMEEGEASDIGGGEDSAFQELPELSSRSRPLRLRHGTIFEMFEAERGHHRHFGEGTSAPMAEGEKLDSDDDEDADFDVEAEPSGEEEEEAEEQAREREAEEQEGEREAEE